MPSIYIAYYKSPVGELVIGSYLNELCLCDWRYRKQRDVIDARLLSAFNTVFVEKETNVIKETIKQLEEYFVGKRQIFELPLLLIGSDFQKSVWKELQKVAYGKTSTYMELSKNIGNTRAIRAVAAANGANAISIIVPCHRIIGSNGSLVGYAGGLQAKKKLLEMERKNTSGEIQLTLDI
jgi:methylated-DNA-[protein]-cysteine S-methyltransferase